MPRKTNAQLTTEEQEAILQAAAVDGENTAAEKSQEERRAEESVLEPLPPDAPIEPLECDSLLSEPREAETLPALDPQNICAEQDEIPELEPKPKQEKSPTKKPKQEKPKQEKPKRTAAAKKAEDKPADKPVSARQAFYQLDFRELDRNLSPEQEQEWNSIYASYRSGSILTGTVSGVDENTFDMTGENGKTERRTVRSLVVIGYRVKVLIPETEVWMEGDEKPAYVTRSMVGAQVDYVIMNVDRVSECAIASRRMALVKRRRHFSISVGELTKCTVLVVGAKRLLTACGGFDLILTQRDLSYTAIADLRTEYKTGQELSARLLAMKDGKPVISVKEVNPNPFDGAELRHPVDSRRQAVIEGKYAGGVFCRLPDGVTCLCLYSNNHFDGEFYAGDRVLIHITRFDYSRKLVYARIISKW